LRRALDDSDPEIIFHLAAQPLVRESYQTPYETMETNFMGTCNLLEAVRQRERPCVVIVVTSDKCYENREQRGAYSESDAMGGHDPYSASKGAVELLVASYRRSYFPADRCGEHRIKVSTVRAGNVIGGGDWARDRIVPDIVSHLRIGHSIPVRNPHSVRPWQHVLEPLSGYMMLAAKMLASDEPHLCDGWNFGPEEESNATVQELVERFCAAWGSGNWVDESDAAQPHEARLLRLSIEKATSHIGWRPTWSFKQAITRTARWYREFHSAAERSMRDACLRDIAQYSADRTCSIQLSDERRGRRVVNAA
jgi:CDP-glucose 4,6-dehydratase